MALRNFAHEVDGGDVVRKTRMLMIRMMSILLMMLRWLMMSTLLMMLRLLKC